MEKNPNVKSIAAMFNTAPAPMEGAEKSPVNSFQARRAEFAKNNINPAPGTFPKKPASPKPLQVPKSASDEAKPPVIRPGGFNRSVGSIHGSSQDSDTKPIFPKPPGFKTFEQPKDEPKVPFPKPIGSKPFMAINSPQENRFGVKPPIPAEPKDDLQKPMFPRPSTVKASENESKPYIQKKPPFGSKPPLNPVGSPVEVNSNKHGLASKTFSNSLERKKQTEEDPEQGHTSQTFPGVTLRSTAIKPVQSPFLKQSTEEPHERPKTGTLVKDQAKANHDGSPSLPTMSKYPRIPSASQIPVVSEISKQKNSTEPRRKPLPTPAQLGPPPQKPARPPNVDIERFRRGKTMGNKDKVPVSEQRSSALSAALPPPPPAVKSPAGPSIPSLPPRMIRSTNDDYKSEDGAIIDDISEESDEECYQDIEEHSAQYRREQEEKNEKKRKKELEQAKKEQKEKEKKEVEIKKRFKLSDKVDVIHQAKANMDYKGGKSELSFKNGDQIEIIRVTDNPEGKWLGRMKGYYGYIKTSMVKVDYDSLPRKKPPVLLPVKDEGEQDIYDDVGDQDSISNHSVGAISYFPPPPPDDDDIYDGVDDDSPDSSAPQEEEKSGPTLWGLFKKRKGTEHKKKNVQEKTEQEENEEELGNSTFESDVYDDVDSSDFPPPPIESSLSVTSRDSIVRKSPDLQTLKRMKKEEKEFRKKFKFTGEIRVLSTVQVVTNLATKKWGSKDLPLKPGETLSVIQHGSDSTLLCKNNEGKYGYVSGSNIIDNDGDIYDDIGEDCIYDND